ncbi:MAG: hypothetical protein ACI8RZ_004230, partial [Myxococcota bacterium]
MLANAGCDITRPIEKSRQAPVTDGFAEVRNG